MWSEILVGYGIFILEILTILLVIAGIVVVIFALKQKKHGVQGELDITDLSEEFEENRKKLQDFHLTEDELKEQEKQTKKAEKAKAKEEKARRKNGEVLTKDVKPTLLCVGFQRGYSSVCNGIFA